jgi:outer membrane receptor for ferrienterochelin and colicins
VTLDFGLEKRLAGLGQTGVNVFLREQRDVLARRVYLASNGRWEEQPDNVGSATVWGIETDIRTNLVWAGLGPDWSLSANASLLQSKMRDGPAAGERIPGQARYLANVNLAKPLKITGGWYGGTTVAIHGSSDQAGSTAAYHAAGRQGSHAQLDVFIGSVIPAIGFWRLNVYNITNYKQSRQRTVTDANGISYSESTARRLTPRVFLTFGTRF